MSTREYTISADKVAAVDYEILVIGYPKEELEDLLTDLVSERGRIARSRYEDFLIAHCIANLNQFMAHITSITSSGADLDLLVVREEVVDLVLKYNENLKPSNIIINRNKILKLQSENENTEEIQLLEDNSFWSQSFYDKDGNYTPTTQKDSSGDSLYLKKYNEERAASGSKKNTDDIKSISELPFVEVHKFWDRFNEYITIKQYTVVDVDKILNFRYFYSSTSFDTFVVSHCISNIEEIYERIDGMGISVDPSKIVVELYNLCKEVNPALTFTRFKELREGEEEKFEDFSKNSAQSSQATQPSFGFNGTRKKENKPSFKDVPREELLTLNNNMKMSLVGQDDAIVTLTEAIKRASVGLKDPVKPIGSFLFAGRTGCGKCVDEDTLIFSEDGMKSIKSFYTGENKQEPLELSLSTMVGTEKTEFIYKEGKKQGRVIETSIGNRLGGSMIHPVVVIDNNGEIKFKRFYEVENGDFVAVQYNQNYFSTKNVKLPFTFIKHVNDQHSVQYTTPNKMNKELAYYIGLLTGDGGLTINGRICFSSADKQLVHSFYDLSKKLFGVDVKTASGKYDYYYNSVHIYQFLKDACKVSMDYAKNKTIPATILESDVECVKAFIQGLMDTDGYYENTSKTVGITLSTKKLIEDLQVVLFNFGIISFIRHKKVKYKDEFRDAYVLRISGKFVNKYFETIGFKLTRKMDKKYDRLTTITNTNKDIIPNIASKLKELCSYYTFDRKFHRKYGGYLRGLRSPSRVKLNNFLKDVVNYTGISVKSSDLYKYLKSFVNQDIFWAQITSIEEKELNLYDFTVPGSHTFISNGFVSHNTLATKVLADTLIRTRKNRIVIDCSEYSSDHEYAKLIGAPAGYMGHDSGGVLTNAIVEDPFSVVVFDEIEKASSKVYDLLLQILDEGRLTDGKGMSVSFKDSIVVMTSNIGVREIDDVGKTIGFGDVAILTEDKKSKALDAALKKKFKPEFLNRIDAIVHFKDLTDEDYMKVIELELARLNSNLKTNSTDYKNTVLTFDKKTKAFIFEKGVDVKYGARPIKRTIERYISNEVAGLLLETNPEDVTEIKVTTVKDKIKLKPINTKQDTKSLLMHSKEKK